MTAWSQSLSLSTSEENYTHSYKRITLIIFTVLFYSASLVLNTINPSASCLFGINFFSDKENYVLDFLTESFISSRWANCIWIFVYLWQAIWLIYGVSTIFRKSSSDYLYKYPPVLHWLIYLNFSISNLLNLFCLMLWSNGYYELTTFYSFMVFISLYIAVFYSLFKLTDYQREMIYTEKTRDVWSIRLLVHNGMFLYASWAFLVFLVVLSITLISKYDINKENAQLILICILFTKLTIYFFLENFVAYKYCKFVFSPWIIYAAFLAHLSINYNFGLENNFNSLSDVKINLIFHVFLIVFFFLLFISKIIKFICSEFFYQNRFSANF